MDAGLSPGEGPLDAGTSPIAPPGAVGRRHGMPMAGAPMAMASGAHQHLERGWFGAVVGAFAVLWALGLGQVDLWVGLAATATGILILLPIWAWLRRGMDTLPLFELICLYLFMSTCPSVFIKPVEFIGSSVQRRFSASDMLQVYGVLACAFTAAIAGYFGARHWRIRALPPYHLSESLLVPYSLVFLFLATVSPVILPRIPYSMAKVYDLVTVANASVAIYTLSRLWAGRRLQPLHTQVFFVLLVGYLAVNLATGWLVRLAYPMLFFELGQFQVHRRIPWGRFAASVMLLVVVNGAKGAFRERYWGGSLGGGRLTVRSVATRTVDWLAMSFSNVDSLAMVTQYALTERVSGLGFLAHVVTGTPEEYPHTGLWSYKLIPAMVVPRALWPNKPSVIDLHDRIALRYGYMGSHQRGQVALDIGLIPEAYMAFGLWGVVAVGALLGIFVRFLTNTLWQSHAGEGWELILLGLIRNGALMITWVASSYLAGIWQTMILIGLLYLPVRIVHDRYR